MNYKYLFFLFTIIISIPNFGQENTYYQMPDDKILSSEIYNAVVPQFEANKIEAVFYDTIQQGDSLIYKVGLKLDNAGPYTVFKKKIGEEFPFKLFGIEKSDKPMFVNFWFTSCMPCIKEIPELNELKEDFEGKADFIAITFNTKIEVEKFLEKRPINFQHITDQKQNLGAFGVRSYPMNLLLDKEGKIVFVSGMLDYSKWEVELLLKEMLGEG